LIPAEPSIALEKLHIPYTMIQRLSPIIISKMQVGKQENIRRYKSGTPKIAAYETGLALKKASVESPIIF
jgi:hypothetical protein